MTFIFRILALLNRALPSYKDKDLKKLSGADKLVIGWRYWVTKNTLRN